MNTSRSAAISSLTYLVRSLLAVPEERRSGDVGVGAQPWCELLERATRTLRRDLRPVVIPLLSTLIRRSAAFTTEQRALVGKAARRVLTFAWGEGVRDPGAVLTGIEGVSRTFISSPKESAALLRRILEPVHLAAHGYQELPRLAGELGGILAADPALVEDVYRAALAHDEESDAATALGGESQIMALRSNRRQDYELALYSLGELFPQFMAVAPVEATGAVIAAVEARVAESARQPVASITGEAIRLGKEPARFAEDYSHIWDGGHSHRYDLHHQLLDGFEEELVRLGGTKGNPALLASVLSGVARENRFAALWRRVLSAAIREPAGLGLKVWTLAASPPVLISSDTLELIGRYLQLVFPLLGVTEREEIERAILSIRKVGPGDEGPIAHWQARLLGCLPSGSVVTTEVGARLKELAATGGPPPNTPLFEVGEATAEEYTEDQWLAEQGVALDEGPNRRLRELTAPFASARVREKRGTNREDLAATLTALRALHHELRSGSKADERVTESGWTHLAAACAELAGADWLESEAEAARFVRAVLLEAAESPCPRPNTERDEHYEKYGGLSPSPRWEAAGGLLNLMRVPTLGDAAVVGAIRRLAEDPLTEVRAEPARRVGALFQSAPDAFWPILRRTESVETSRRIIRYELNGVRPLVNAAPRELGELAHNVFNRFREDSAASEIRSECLGIIIDASARGGDPYQDALIDTVVSESTRFVNEVVFLVQTAAATLTKGPVDPPDPTVDRGRLASFALLERIVGEVNRKMQAVESSLRGKPPAEWGSDVRAQLEALQRVAHELGSRVYFASGSFDRSMAARGQRRDKLTEEVRRRFLKEGTLLLGLLTKLRSPEVVHRTLEALAGYVEIDPRAVFLAAVRGIREGATTGYQFEPLAVNLVVGLVRRYLADYRALFRDDKECRTGLIEVLNIFVRAGWPEVLELTYRLEEIFR
jgi:hypothetical protein